MVGKNNTSPQFFSPAQIERVRTFQANKDNKEVQHQQTINNRKAQTFTKKYQKKNNKIEKTKIALKKRKAKAVKNQVHLKLKKVTKEGCQRYLNLKKQSIKPSKVQKTCKK